MTANSATAAEIRSEGVSIDWGHYERVLGRQLATLRQKIYTPASAKTLRKFTSGEAAKLLGVSDSHLRQMDMENVGPRPEVTDKGKRLYTLDDVNALRRHFASIRKNPLSVLPHRRPGEKLQVVAVASFKGGSGKTTTSAALCQHLALAGYRVLALDLDPQASLTTILGLQPETDLGENDSLFAALSYDDQTHRPISEVVRQTYFPGLDLVPANVDVQEWEHQVPAYLQHHRGAPFYRRIQDLLAEVESAYDVVVLDCPPQLGFLTLAAMTAATGVVIPVHPQMLDVLSLQAFLKMTHDLMGVVEKSGARVQRDWIGFLATRHDPNDGTEVEIVGMLRALFGSAVLTRVALKSAAVASAGLYRKTIYELDRTEVTRSTYDRALEAISGVNEEIEGHLKKSWGRQ